MKLQLTKHTEYSPDSEVYELHSFRYIISKKINTLGELISASRTGLIKITVNAFPSMQLIRWAWGYKCLYDGTVSLTEKKQENGDIQFGKASCKALRLHYQADAPDTVTLTMEIDAESFSASGTNIFNK